MTSYNPMTVMMGQPGKTGVPYVGGKPSSGGSVGPISAGGPFTGSNGGGTAPTPTPPAAPAGPSNTLGAESVRATGTGPFDSAYRQDLATFAGGLFNKPGGNLSFNPTDPNAFGQATGGGNAPLLGMPNTLLQQALGGNPFTYTPPAPKQGATNSQPNLQNFQEWLNQFMQNGRGMRMGAPNF
jgi:hypothetical protein